jgi:hypothetical protein
LSERLWLERAAAAGAKVESEGASEVRAARLRPMMATAEAGEVAAAAA